VWYLQTFLGENQRRAVVWGVATWRMKRGVLARAARGRVAATAGRLRRSWVGWRSGCAGERRERHTWAMKRSVDGPSWARPEE
jgi:hypothetical protein